MGANVLGAHARLAAIDPAALDPGSPAELLDALLIGAGLGTGIALDPAHPERAAASGAEPPSEALALLADEIRAGRGLDGHVAEELLFRLFGGVRSVVIPITAGDETLLLLLLPEPPLDAVGFSSVAAHAASLLLTLRMSDQVRARDFELKYRVWELESLYDVGLSIAGTLDTESLADDILMKSVSLLNARAGALVVRDVFGDGQPLVKNFGDQLLTEATGVDLADVLVANAPESRPGALAHVPAQKLLAVPIESDGRRLGLLLVADKENRAGGVDDFTENDTRILRLFGNQAAIALENARLHRDAIEKERIEREIELAASIQKTILPDTIPEVSGLVIAGGNRPTRQVGGDYFDVFPLPDGRTAFNVADVSGKGVPAALLVSTVHACLHLLVAGGADDLPGLVARTNRHLVRFSSARKFVTLFLAVYDPATRVLRYVNAGHNPGLWLSGETVTELHATGVPIGMMPAAVHGERSVTLGPGDLVVLYSDGITEAIDAADEEFGMVRLVDLLVRLRHEVPEVISREVFAAVSAYTRGVAQYDDQTVLVARAV